MELDSNIRGCRHSAKNDNRKAALNPEFASASDFARMNRSKQMNETACNSLKDLEHQHDLPFQNIVLLGAHSVGKSTLAEAIVAKTEHEVIHIKEIARTVMTKLCIDVNDIKNIPEKSFQLQQAIIKEHCRIEAEVRNKFAVLDRCAIDALIYADEYCGNSSQKLLLEMPETRVCLERYKEDDCILFLIEPDAACLKDDGIRMMSDSMEKWISFSEKYKTLMKECDIKYRIIKDLDLDLRCAQVFQALSENN